MTRRRKKYIIFATATATAKATSRATTTATATTETMQVFIYKSLKKIDMEF